ncbi:uncharacterized protein B0I36DRAFT_223666, partial [Microdochium trichocladiopsis]
EEEQPNSIGKLYGNVHKLPITGRYVLYTLPIAIILAIPIGTLVALKSIKGTEPKLGEQTVNTDAGKVVVTGLRLLDLFVWAEATWISLWGAKAFAHVLPSMIKFFCGVVSVTKPRYERALYLLENYIMAFLAFLASWMTYKAVMERGHGHFQWVTTCSNILVSCFISSGVLLGEKVFIQLVSISYQQQSFQLRKTGNREDVDNLQELYKEAMSPQAAQRGYRNYIKELVMKDPVDDHNVSKMLKEGASTEQLAATIWEALGLEKHDTISRSRFHGNLKPLNQLFSRSPATQILSNEEWGRRVKEIGQEYRAITSNETDMAQAIRSLDKVCLCLVVFMAFLIFFSFLQASLLTSIATAGTMILSMSFMFAVTAQEFLGSCIFLFVKHPYDVGDDLVVMNTEREQLIVIKISLRFTIFSRSDTQETVQISNIILNNLFIENRSRSKVSRTAIKIDIPRSRSNAKLEGLLNKFVQEDDNSPYCHPNVKVFQVGLGDEEKLQCSIAIEHKVALLDVKVRVALNDRLM